MNFSRYAVYYVPQDTALAQFGASWLGWDIATGQPVEQSGIPGLPVPVEDFTAGPARYGLHATVVPPFHLSDRANVGALAETLRDFCTSRVTVTLDGLDTTLLGRFVALVPVGDVEELKALAADALRICDPMRAALSKDELARHRAKGLSAAQDALLQRWGYPYVMQTYRFHITLTGKMPKSQARAIAAVLGPYLQPRVSRPFTIDQLALVGEDTQGRFHLIEQFPLLGSEHGAG